MIMLVPYSSKIFTINGPKVAKKIEAGDIVYGIRRSGSLLLYKVLKMHYLGYRHECVNIKTKNTVFRAFRYNYILTPRGLKKVENLMINEDIYYVAGFPPLEKDLNIVEMTRTEKKMYGILQIDSKKNLDFKITHHYNYDVGNLNIGSLPIKDIDITLTPIVDIIFDKVGLIIYNFHIIL